MKNPIRVVINKTRRVSLSVLSQRMTVKVVSEDVRDSISFRVNLLVVTAGVFLLGGMGAGLLYLHQVSRVAPQELSRQQDEINALQANLDDALRELQTLLRTVRPLEEELENMKSTFTADADQAGTPVALTRMQVTDFFQDLTPRRSTSAQAAPTVQDVEELRGFIGSLEGSLNALGQTRDLLATTDSYLRDVPHYWPVENGLGVVTMEYGPNLHPFTGQWYLHKGFDIAGPVGLPLVAAADGIVVENVFDPSYGNSIIIRHRYGFHTRYAHMHRVFVEEGQRVLQGERIGTLGSSGFSSGPHLHFEVIIGNEVLDPAPFLMISNTFQRGGHASSRMR